PDGAAGDPSGRAAHAPARRRPAARARQPPGLLPRVRRLRRDRGLGPRPAGGRAGAGGAGPRRGGGVEDGAATRSSGRGRRAREPDPLMAAPDPITLGVVWGALQSICVEIGSSVQRTAYSIQAREGQDFSVAVFDARGRMSAQGPYSPGHMGAMYFAVRNFLTAFPVPNLRPADTLLLNY